MTPFKRIQLVAIATLFALAACKKDTMMTPTDQVLTPVGYMDRSKVHFIGDGFSLSVSHGRLQKVDREGRMVEDFGEVKPLEDRYNPGKSALVPAASGWIAYSYWSNPNTSKPITYFTTNWTVPSAPTRQGSQTIFLFNGMQDGLTSTSYIIQPVLQWGPSAAGGGKYWAITNWYVSSSQAFYGSLATVSAGTSLQGIMEETAASGGNYSYYCYFTGYPSSTALQVNNVPEAFWAAETLESYGVTTPSTMYPPNSDVAMSSIQILQGSTNASLSWSTAQAVSGSAQKAVVVSNASPGGQVDIYFR
ncbi:hypothetical protein [Dinghuibacter silviterrae]|uniref:Uncharacterized protein n=1 Tax=Dinghuibacter silviterrae TaxID=1539049 RepID=A0A4R8DG60_9BACT|nr:hypothetical protein [Dinghuibacter silviterrae]TDW96437.1 hypothetical protein EDB95_4268 [Dinghuibacter silviterrae]